MKLVIFGLTLSSSWGNGHATIWRGLCRALLRRGHQVVFFERDVPYYAAHRDLHQLPGGELCLYPAWAEGLASAQPEDTIVTRAFSGRPGRALANAYARAASAPDAPDPAPYPVQRGLTAAMRADAAKAGDLDRMQAWAGQASRLARAEPAGDVVSRIWAEAQALLAG